MPAAVGAPLERDRSNANAQLQVAEYGLRWYEMGARNYRKQKSQALDALHFCRAMVAKSMHRASTYDLVLAEKKGAPRGSWASSSHRGALAMQPQLAARVAAAREHAAALRTTRAGA